MIDPQTHPLFFILHADSGTWEPSLTSNLHGTLTLNEVNPNATYFIYEDAQSAGQMKIEKFIEIWEPSIENQTSYPSRVGLIHYNSSKQEDLDTEIYLTDPHYDIAKRSLTFQGEVLGESMLQTQMTNVSIYIDDSSRYVHFEE